MPTTRTRRDKPGYQRKKRELSEEWKEELRRFVEKIQNLQASSFQERIFEAAQTGQGKYVVNAGPGSGKTTTAIKLSTFFPGRAIYFSFNKKIQLDTNDKLRALGSKMFALTLHAFGKSCIEKYLGRESDVDDDKYSRLIDDFVGKRFPTFLLRLRQVDDEELATMQFDARVWAKDLVHYVQVTLSQPSEATLLALIDQFSLNDINPAAKVWPLVVEVVAYALEGGLAEFRQSGKISFDDMVCFPAGLAEIPVRQFDHVIIDEAQDLSKAQLRLVQRACHPDTQVFAVGDPRQSIYAFTGADHDSIDNIIRAFHAQLLPLRVCYRCGTAIIDLANQLGGEIIPAPGAHEGEVQVMEAEEEYLKKLRKRDAVITRTTAVLVRDCLKVLKTGQRAMVLGKKIGESIAVIVSRIEEVRVAKRGKRLLHDDLSNFLDLLEAYRIKQQQIIQDTRKKDVELAIDELKDKVETARAFYTAYIARCVDPGERCANDPKCEFSRTAEDFKRYIRGLFTEDESGNMIQFMTAHRSKGLEFERVYIIDTDLFPHPLAKSDKQKIQEDNLMYVAITRAIQQLTFIGAPFSCLRLPGDELEIEESYAPGLVVADETEQESELPVEATVAAGQKPTREEPLTSVAPDQVEQQPAKRGRGRPRKGGADAALRKGFEVTFDLRTIELLDAATDNRSEYLETLALERLAPQDGEEQLAAKLEARCNAFPALVAKKLRKIRATLGVHAAWEASEAVILFVDPQRASYP